jgi:glucose/arabinose dehydrogenase
MARWLTVVLATLLLASSAGATHATGQRRCGLPLPAASELTVAGGFRADVYASGLDQPTALAFGPDGRLYATEGTGAVVSIRAGSCRPRALLGGFPTPLGLAWIGNRLYVSSQGRVDSVLVLRGVARDPRRVLSHLPFGEHQEDNVVRGPEGRLYLGIGATCNACRERDRRSASIVSFTTAGGGLRVVATGLRNPFGLAFQPRTGALYASVNGRDDVDQPGNPEPAEMVVRVSPGRQYGWPDCWPSARLLRLVGRCRGVARPAAYLEPHSSADGIVFGPGGDLFVAEWGQYLSKRFGRRVVRVRLASRGAASRVTSFASGFDHPLALALDRRGALLVADYGRGLIYRIQAVGSP